MFMMLFGLICKGSHPLIPRCNLLEYSIMEVNLPPELETFVGEQVASGGYTSSDEVLAEGLALLQAQREADDESISRGIKDAEAGRTQPLDEAMSELTSRFKA